MYYLPFSKKYWNDLTNVVRSINIFFQKKTSVFLFFFMAQQFVYCVGKHAFPEEFKGELNIRLAFFLKELSLPNTADPSCRYVLL